MTDLNDPIWKSLKGGYGELYNASVLLRELESTNDENRIKEIMNQLWSNLYHQGDVDLVSYFSLPHLIRIGIENKICTYDILGLVAAIEIARHSNNPDLPEEYLESYCEEIQKVTLLICQHSERNWSKEYTVCATAAIAAVNGQIDLAETILNTG
ncbi:MAG: hypothetical protein AAGI23_01025 [Bacteroidota bacterium]